MRVTAKSYAFVLLASVSLSAYSATPTKTTIVDYFLAIVGLNDEAGQPHKFKIKDIKNGYLATEDEEAALFYKKDKTPILVLDHLIGDSPDITAHELKSGKWHDITKETVLTKISDEAYLIKRFAANGMPMTLSDYQEYASKPETVEFPRVGKKIVVRGNKNLNAKRPWPILFSIEFKNDKFVLVE